MSIGKLDIMDEEQYVYNLVLRQLLDFDIIKYIS